MQRLGRREVLLPEVVRVERDLVYIEGGQVRVELRREALGFEGRDTCGESAHRCTQGGVLDSQERNARSEGIVLGERRMDVGRALRCRDRHAPGLSNGSDLSKTRADLGVDTQGCDVAIRTSPTPASMSSMR